MKMEKPSLNRGGGLTHCLSASDNAVLTSLARCLKPPRKLASCDPNDPHDGLAG